MKILVAGASGFIGGHVARELVRRGAHTVIRMSRAPRSDAGGEWRPGDVRDPESLLQVTKGVDCVVHAVQFPNQPIENPRKGWTYLEIDGRGTCNMVEAAVANGVKRFVYLSGAGTDESRPEPPFRAKVMAEAAIRASGMEYVILRPSWVYGPDDHGLSKFVGFTRHLPFVPVIGDGRAKVQPVHIDDVTRVVVDSLDLDAATNRIFELGGPQALSMNEVLLAVQKALGIRKPLVHHPVGLMKAVAAPLSLLPKAPLSPAAIDFLMLDNTVDPRPAEEAFGFRFRSLDEGLAYLRPGAPL